MQVLDVLFIYPAIDPAAGLVLLSSTKGGDSPTILLADDPWLCSIVAACIHVPENIHFKFAGSANPSGREVCRRPVLRSVWAGQCGTVLPVRLKHQSLLYMHADILNQGPAVVLTKSRLWSPGDVHVLPH